MGLFKAMEKINIEDMFIGEIYKPEIFTLDENGKKDGAVKAVSLNKFDIAIKNAEGDYVSVSDGTVYSDGSVEKITAGKADGKKFFWNVESYSKITGKKGKISKRAAAKEAQIINQERHQSLGL